MNQDDESFLRDFYRAVTTGPLEANDPAYVDLHAGPDRVDPVHLLARSIEWTPDQSVQLFTGLRGTGMSTELRRLADRLKKAGFLVVLCDLEDYLDLSQPITLDDLLTGIAKAFSKELQALGQEVPDPPLFNSKESVHGFFGSSVKKMWERHEKKTEVVLLVDSMEHASGPAAEWSHWNIIESIFVHYSEWLELPHVHAVYTVPFFLSLQVPNLGSLFSPGGVYTQHAVPLRGLDGEEKVANFELLAQVAEERDDLWRLIPSRETLDILIGYSGGLVGDFLRLLAEVIRRADGLPVSKKVVDAAITHLQGELLPVSSLDLQKLGWVALVHQEHENDLFTKHPRSSFFRFLATRLVLGYEGDETWYDIHPLIADYVKERTTEPSSQGRKSASHREGARGEAWFARRRESSEVSALTLHNICAFEQLDLNFSTVHGKGQWVILLGDNGVGKSTVLRALALAAMEPAMATSLLALRSPSAPFLRNGSDSGAVSLECSTGTFKVQLQNSSSTLESMNAWAENGAIRPPIFAYGCQRGTVLGGAERDVKFRLIDDVGSLFDHTTHLIHAETWIRRLQSAALSEGGAAQAFFEAVQQTLVEVLSGVESLEVRSDQIWLKGPNVGDVPLSAMSDGYITTAGWVIDLIARWADHCTREGLELDGSFHQEMTGLVLVDEIDLHLHPLWQLEIVSKLRQTFPRLSFVVTTHNPLTLLGAQPGEIHVLRREEDGRVIAQQRDIPPGTRADEVLTGFWFNLPSTLDQETLDLLEKHRQLLREGAQETDPELQAVEKKLRQGLGTFADTSLDRMALRVAAQIMDEEAANYRDVAPERREEIRQEMLAELRKKRAH